MPFKSFLKSAVAVALLYALPAQADVKKLKVLQTKLQYWDLLQGYEQRLLKDTLSFEEYNYALTYLCPIFPVTNMRLCNSSAVGNGMGDPSKEPGASYIPVTIDDKSIVHCRVCRTLGN